MKRQLLIVGISLAIVIVAIAAFFILSGMRKENVMRVPPPIKKYVETQPVEYSSIETEVTAYGRVRTAQAIDLISEVSGRMTEGSIRLKAGQRFTRGTLLYSVDDKEASLNLKSTKSNFLRDLAAILPDLKIDYSDNFKVWESYFNDLDIDRNFPELPEPKSSQEKTFLATQGIYSSYYAIKSTEERLSKYRYYAPFDGSISEVVMESGAYVNTGTRIGRIIKSKSHELQVAVETDEIAWIQEGSPAGVYSDETQQTWEGTVTRISDFVNENTQTVDVFISIVTNGHKIFDGQFLRASIPSRTIENGLIIPRNILYNGSEVFVLRDTTLRTERVNVLRTDREQAIINGLSEGTDLVIEPLVNAHSGITAYKREMRDIDMENPDRNSSSKVQLPSN
jgi:membrane fusion protein (multidrug efflux system)